MSRRHCALAGLVAALAAASVSGAGQPAPTAVPVPGLAEPVEIVRDRWGVNHIYAKNETDLFFAQGYAAARDRLFQLELWRRLATGTVAEILGPSALRRDIGARLHQFRGNLDAELNHYHPRGKQIVEAFVRGINAYVDETERTPALLPLEFKALGIKPRHWTPVVVVSRHAALTSNVADEVRFARALKTSSPRAVRSLLYFQGGEPIFELDPAIDMKTFPDDVLELYTAFRSAIDFTPEHIDSALRATTSAPGRPPEDDAINPLDVGSNNWVVSGARTQSTYPLLANDPHRAISTPSLRYMVHLVAPGWNVIGAGEPAVPGVSIGHNEHGAWGLTIFGNDSEDLYVYDTNPANANEYRYQNTWEAMRVVRETIPVKGGTAENVELKYTRHGPVLFEDRANHKAYALRAAWLETGGAPYLASLRMDQATSWEEFREACSHNNMPAENMIWADRTGSIGWQAAGVQPLRKNWSGLLPVPGDGRYEWNGLLPIKELPHEANPARGFIGTANNYLMPNDYPHREAVHYLWSDPFRSSRVTELLASGRLFSVPEMVRMQNDELSLPARALVPLLHEVSLPSGPAARARDLLRGWDFVLDKDSIPAGIYAMWQRRLVANTRERLAAGALRPLANQVSLKRIIDTLHAPDSRLGEDPTGARDALLALSLDEAVAELTRRFGPDPQKWQYGQTGFHHALIRHPLADVVNEATRARLNVGPLPRGGDAYTINATTVNDNQTSGGSFKVVIDTEDWDNSVAINTPGQSGNPDDPHYRDLFELWARGRYFTLAYTRSKVEAVQEKVTRFEPAVVKTVAR